MNTSNDLSTDEQMRLYYFRVNDIWQKLCEFHSHLYDLTCEEYNFLLSSDLEELDEIVQLKDRTVQNIAELNDIRTELIDELNETGLLGKKIGNVQDRLLAMDKLETEKGQNYLYKFNELLIDIIENIQRQNKKNKIFLNKAIISMGKLKAEALGQKNYDSYDSKGAVRNTDANY